MLAMASKTAAEQRRKLMKTRGLKLADSDLSFFMDLGDVPGGFKDASARAEPNGGPFFNSNHIVLSRILLHLLPINFLLRFGYGNAVLNHWQRCPKLTA